MSERKGCLAWYVEGWVGKLLVALFILPFASLHLGLYEGMILALERAPRPVDLSSGTEGRTRARWWRISGGRAVWARAQRVDAWEIHVPCVVATGHDADPPVAVFSFWRLRTETDAWRALGSIADRDTAAARRSRVVQVAARLPAVEGMLGMVRPRRSLQFDDDREDVLREWGVTVDSAVVLDVARAPSGARSAAWLALAGLGAGGLWWTFLGRYRHAPAGTAGRDGEQRESVAGPARD